MSRELCPHGGQMQEKCESCARIWANSTSAAWEDGFRFGAQQWWPADQKPPTNGTFVVRDKSGNMEVVAWACDWNGKNGDWSAEMRDVDREQIIAWLRIPDFR